MTQYRIPKYIDMPFGYTVEVKQLNHKDFVEENGDGCFATWSTDDRTIYLDKSRDIKKRRADLVHEMIHVVGDWQAYILGDGKKTDATD